MFCQQYFWGGAQCAGKCTRDGSRGDRDDSRRVVLLASVTLVISAMKLAEKKGFIARYEINRNVGAGGYIMYVDKTGTITEEKDANGRNCAC